jgi:formylglycine-generating enzyme required for sulfatase activity
MLLRSMLFSLLLFSFCSLSSAQKLIEPEMVSIPAGSFMMGNVNNYAPTGAHYLEADLEFLKYELPVHKVDFRAFKLGKYEVTFAQYDVFAEATNRTKPKDDGKGRGQQPVGYVSWEDATAYAAWLAKETGKKFRLPSEAEWQYAARAGTTTEFYWGNTMDHNLANFGTDECCNRFVSGADKWLGVAPVGQFPPNQFGLYDMLGNVSEWVQDCVNENYVGAPTDGSAWMTGECGRHVTLGGQMHSSLLENRVSSRNWGPTVIGKPTRRINFGFRIAQDIE